MFSFRSTQAGFALHVVLAVLLAIGGVVAIGLFAKNQIQINQERQQFIAAEAQVTALGEKIAQATSPDKHEAEAYCSKGSKGIRICSAKYYQIHTGTSGEAALKLATIVENQLKPSTQYTVGNSQEPNIVKSFKFTSNALSCATTLYFKENGNAAYADGVLAWAIPDNSTTTITSCSGQAMADYFPLKD
jgi:hypothetical protein